MIKVRLLLLLIATIMLTSAHAWLILSCGGNDLIMQRLHGPVRTMRVDIATCAKGVTNPRRLAEMYTFDTHGYCTRTRYPSDSSRTERSETKSTYDGHGCRLRYIARYYKKGALSSTSYREFTYDRAGRLRTSLSYSKSKCQNPRMKQRTTYTYDAQNRVIREDLESLYLGAVHPSVSYIYSYSSNGVCREGHSYHPAGKVSIYCREWYNTKGLLVKMEIYDEGKLTTRSLISYNKQGDEVHMVYYNKGKQRSITCRGYRYDQHGNWTQCTEGTIVRRNGKDVFVTSQTVYRTFTYY